MRHTLFLLLIVVPLLTIGGCGSPRGRALKLQESAYREITNDPPVYEIQSSSGEPIWGTGIQSCGHSARTSEKALVRQLLIGFTNLRQLGTEQSEVGGRAELEGQHLHFSRWSALQEETPLLLEVISARKDSCVTDIVIWRVAPSNDAASLGVSPKEYAQIIERFLGGRPL